ncbi:MAG: hypothetical protein WAL32_10045 [Terriglobales bacterium]
MPLRPEYDEIVNRWNRATVAGFGLALFGLLAASVASAQIHGAPPSVTSMGFGGRTFNGVAPSVTSLGPRGYTPGFNPAFPNSQPFFGTSSSFSHPHHHPHHPQGDASYYGIPYYGYYGDSNYDNGTDAQNYAPEDENNVGPTVFDRRGGYIAPAPPVPAEALNDAAPSAPPAQADSQPATPTVLVFKDGHQLEVENYAIVGSTLYDLTEGHRRKVPLADLDLTATAKENDDRGIDFNLPTGTVAN